MKKQEAFFVFLIIITVFTIAISMYAIAYLINNIMEHSSNIVIWLEEPVKGPKGTIITRFLDLIVMIISGLFINIFLILYCIEEYKKL